MAITHINDGRMTDATALLDDAVRLAERPDFSAHLVRGTARALQRQLKGRLLHWLHRCTKLVTLPYRICSCLTSGWAAHGCCLCEVCPAYRPRLRLADSSASLTSCLTDILPVSFAHRAEAVQDFDVAISLMPLYGDAWKRRGQAKNALEDLNGAAKVSCHRHVLCWRKESHAFHALL